MVKWILLVLGYVYRGPVGAVLGYLIGLFLDRLSWFSLTESTQKTPLASSNKKEENLSFELNLLALCAVVISADGYASAQELHYVRNYFIRLYGHEKAQRVFQLYNKVKTQSPPLQAICLTINQQAPYQTRLQIIHLLFEVASVDGKLHTNEINKIQEIAQLFRILQTDFYETLAFFSVQHTQGTHKGQQELEQAYAILGVSPSATDVQVKQAYREMAKKYHPDRVITQDEALKKSAEEKFKRVQQAYELIQKHREK